MIKRLKSKSSRKMRLKILKESILVFISLKSIILFMKKERKNSRLNKNINKINITISIRRIISTKTKEIIEINNINKMIDKEMFINLRINNNNNRINSSKSNSNKMKLKKMKKY